jgi:hypothetical protein
MNNTDNTDRNPFYIVTLISRDKNTLSSIYYTMEEAELRVMKYKMGSHIDPENGYLWATITPVLPLSYTEHAYRIDLEWQKSTQVS